MAKKPFQTRIDEQLIKQLQDVAKAENRSTNNMVETILSEFCKKYNAGNKQVVK